MYETYWPNLLFKAIHQKDNNLLLECIESGYNINQENGFFKSPLIVAVQMNNLQAIKILIENGADLNVMDIKRQTALDYVPNENKILNDFLNSIGAKRACNFDAIDSKKHDIRLTQLMSCIFHNNLTLLDLQDVNTAAKNGTTPLMLAAFKQNLEFIEMLVENGARINELDHFGNTAFIYQSTTDSNFNKKMAKYLIKNGADINLCGRFGMTPLTFAALNENYDLLDFWLDQNVDINKLDGYGNSALAYTVIMGNQNVAQTLLTKGADINLCGSKGKTPLQWAEFKQDQQMIAFLEENGAK